MSQCNRNLPRVPELALVKNRLAEGCRIVVAPTAGPKLAGKLGIVVGKGTTSSQVRVLLDGSKTFITLHARLVDVTS